MKTFTFLLSLFLIPSLYAPTFAAPYGGSKMLIHTKTGIKTNAASGLEANGLRKNENNGRPFSGFETKNNTLAGGTIAVFPLRIYDNNVAGAGAGINRNIKVKNTGTGILSLTSINVSGTNPASFSLNGLPAFPKSLNPGDSVSFFVAFSTGTTGIKTASINISSDDPLSPITSIPLRGLGTSGLGGANEPSLQLLLNLLEIDINVGDDNINTAVINSNTAIQRAPLLGDEVSIQQFQKAATGNVTITPLAVFGPTDASPIVGMGWYKSGDTSTQSELLSVSNNPMSNGQTVNVNFTGTLSFDPAADTFGFYSHWPHFNNRHLYSEDYLNTFVGSAPHHVRIFPYKINGAVVADTYLVAFEETTSALDYQDIIFVVNNVKKAETTTDLFVENLDSFPSNSHFVFSRVQIPWSRDSIHYNANHDSLKVRIHNNGTNPLIVSILTLSDTTKWQIVKLNTTPYVPGAGLPKIINSGTYLDVTVKFIAIDQGSRVKVLHDSLMITSNDNNFPIKEVYLDGLWQKSGEGDHEPYAQEILNVFRFKTQTGFAHTDPDLGDSTKLKGDEIKPSFFVRADSSRPVLIRQISAYHGCCIATEKIMWYPKGSPTALTTVFTHIAQDGQSLLPRRSLSGAAAAGTMAPPIATVFGFKVGFSMFTEASRNPGKKIGIRVWKAIDADTAIIPNAYILSVDYGGTTSTNYDFQDNTYYVTNVKPATGSAFYSALTATPSDLDFGEKIIQTTNSAQLAIKSLGQNYPDGSSDPVIKISSIAITGENSSEFSVVFPADSMLSPQQTSSITVGFNPATQGLKIADLLIYYNNSLSPLRVPLYGIAKATDTNVVVNYRIKSGSSTPIVVNGKTWSPDTPYAMNNLQPYTNPALSQIAATDEDSLYLIEQSSNGTKKPFSYQIPLPNGNYVVRLHFSEIFWGAPGGGSGGAGSRVQSVKLENQLQLINLDISQAVGVASALIKNIPVTITDGKLNIDFSATVNRPSVSAIEIYSFVSSGPLAINDFNFSGNIVNNGVKLNWTNTGETGIKYYEIDRSTNNTDFSPLGTVPANNAINYNFTDNNPGDANNFYRIKQVSADGTFSYSKIIRINFFKTVTMEVYPNPGTDKINLQFSGITGSQNANLSIQSVSGSVIKTISLVLLSNQKTEIDVSSLSAGIYILHLTSNNLVFNSKFLKK